MRNYRIFTAISWVVWTLAFIGEMITSRTLTVALVFYLAMVIWAGLTIIKEENK